MSGPRPTFVVTARDPTNNTESAMAVDWTTPISVKPPTFGVVISQHKKTHDIIKHAGVFSVNILPAEELDKVWWLGSHTGRKFEDKLSEAGLTTSEGNSDKNAISIDEAIATFECEVTKEVEVGGFTLFIGEVKSASASDAFFDKEKSMWVPESAKLIFRVANDVFVTNEKLIIQPTT
jgi:flavin reductase (DIM6/NTAB) family NADH-FMN oxidoreductase RutF